MAFQYKIDDLLKIITTENDNFNKNVQDYIQDKFNDIRL